MNLLHRFRGDRLSWVAPSLVPAVPVCMLGGDIAIRGTSGQGATVSVRAPLNLQRPFPGQVSNGLAGMTGSDPAARQPRANASKSAGD